MFKKGWFSLTLENERLLFDEQKKAKDDRQLVTCVKAPKTVQPHFIHDALKGIFCMSCCHFILLY